MTQSPATPSNSPYLARLHQAIRRLERWKVMLIAPLLGAFANLGFAPFHIWPATALSIIGLVWLLDGAREQQNWGRSVFFRGWLWGVGFYLVGMHWMVFPFLTDPDQFLVFIWMPLILAPAGLGLFPGLAGLIAGWMWHPGAGRVFAFALAYSATELLRGWLFGGFPWNWLGTVWAPGGAMSQTAALVGLWGLTALTAFLFAAPAALADSQRTSRGLARIVPFGLMIVLATTFWATGARRIATPPDMTTQAVRLVDVGIPQSEKWRDADGNFVPDNAERMLEEYLRLMGDDFESEPRLVIWPEGALPYFLFESPETLSRITERLGDRHLIMGGLHRLNFDPEVYNALFVIDDTSLQQAQKAIYYKHRLVPFGEMAAADFIPFGQELSGLLPSGMQRLARLGVTPGTFPAPIDVEGAPSFLPLICYEALFPELSKNAIGDNRPEMLVNISIDAWFGGFIGPEQHYAQARYRSIETGLPLVRVASRGVTAVVDGTGREVAAALPQINQYGWQSVQLDAQIPTALAATTYSSFSEFILIFVIFSILIFGIISLRL